MENKYKLSEKYKDFLKHEAHAELLEGTTAAGKTTVGILKFMLKVAESNRRQHVISAKTTGVAEKNIINKEFGVIEIFGELVQYKGNGDKDNKLPHILFNTPNGTKVIYILGYDNVDKWKMALGSQFGCVFIDEVNTASIDFVREICTRNDYLMATLNPDDPNLPVYKEFINCSRPLEKYKQDVPKEILNQLTSEEKEGWTYWFFSFYDNASLSEEDIKKKKMSAPKGTKLYKNKILGLRGRTTGLIFSMFERKHNVININQAKKYKRDFNNRNQKEYFTIFTAGLDTSYSQSSPDTLAMLFLGITNLGRCIVLDEEVRNNADLSIPLAPSDIAPRFFYFLERNRREWGLARDVFVDSADQATITELNKYKRKHPCVYNIINSYKKVEIIDRIHLTQGWLNYNEESKDVYYQVLDKCLNHIRELDCYSWKEDKYEPEDCNDHTINASQYAWIPFRNKIGGVR